MDRLNCLRCEYEHKDNGNCTAVGGFCTAVPAAHCKKLKEYLDTGLTPEEIIGLCEMDKRAKMADLLRLEEYQSLGDIARLSQLAEADRDGRCVVLPCKVGDTVWALYDGKIYEVRVQGISLSASGDDTILHFGGYPTFNAWGSSVGKVIFLTHAEAEAAQAGEEKNK